MVRDAGTEIMIACESGGTLETKLGAETGFQSQSLKAAYYLKKAGYNNVTHVKVGCIVSMEALQEGLRVQDS
jgi:hypothetical protein